MRAPAATLLAAVAVAAPLLPALPVHAADPPVPLVPISPVELVIDAIGPSVLKPKSTLTLRGTVVNRGTTPVRDTEVALTLRRRPFSTRGDLAAIAEGRTPLRDASEVADVDLPGGELAPGKAASWKLTVKVADLKLPGNGVYAIGLNLTGTGAEGADADGALDSRTTFLPYLPEPKGYTPTKLSWLWPLIGDTVRDAEGVFPAQLAADHFKPGNRLVDLAAAPGERPVAWILDPQLLDDAATLAGSHRRRSGDKVEKASGDPAAAQWVAQLRQQLTGEPVAATPYADPDVLGLIDTGSGQIVDRALTRARSTTTAVLGRESDTAVVWPPGGVADVATLTGLRRLGARTIVLSGEQFPVMGTLSYTPTGRAKVTTPSGDLEVLIADAGLTRVLDRDLRAPGVFTMAQQQLLAETALITLERPNAARAVLLTPPRRWDPPTSRAKKLLDAFTAAPWVKAAPLDSLSRTRVPSELVDTGLNERPAIDARKLGAKYSREVLAAATDADAVRGVLVEGGRLAEDHETAVLRSASVTWTGNLPAARGYLRQVRQWVRGDLDKVRVIGRPLVTLSDSRGTIPVTVRNGLSQAVRVRPTITPLVSGRLRARSPELLTIRPGRNATVGIPAEAGANGITRVKVELRDAAGNPYGSPTYLRVNVTNYGSVGLIVVLGGGGLLFAVAIVRNIRRVQRHRQSVRSHSEVEEPVQL